MHSLVDWAKGQGRMARALTRWGVLPYHVLRRDPRPGVVVLLYHRIGGRTRSDIDLPVDLFERQMRYLRQRCLIASLDDVARAVSRGDRLPDRDTIVVTFDDAFSDTYELAYPILRRYSVPATVYVPTMYVEDQRPFDFGAFRLVPPERRPRPMTWDQAAEMTRSGLVTIGAHTHRHADMARVGLDDARQELELSDRLIERRLGIRPQHFAYPWGHWVPAVHALAAPRYETVTFGGPARNAYAAMDPKRLWRYPIIQSDGFWLFRARLHALRARDGSQMPDGYGAVADPVPRDRHVPEGSPR